MKKLFETPVAEIVNFEIADVITTSNPGDRILGEDETDPA